MDNWEKFAGESTPKVGIFKTGIGIGFAIFVAFIYPVLIKAKVTTQSATASETFRARGP